MGPTEPPAAGLAGLRVLVVEDDFLIADYIQEVLMEAGVAEVTVAANARDAGAHLAPGRFDLAIVDLNLGGQSGHGVARRLRELDVLFVFSTGYAQDSHRGEFGDVPALTKPYTADMLIGLLSRVLAERKPG